MTLAAEVAAMLADAELRRMGLRESEVGLSRETLALGYLQVAEQVVALVREPLPLDLARAIHEASSVLTARLRDTQDIFSPQAQVAISAVLGDLARRVRAQGADAAPMLATLEEADAAPMLATLEEADAAPMLATLEEAGA